MSLNVFEVFPVQQFLTTTFAICVDTEKMVLVSALLTFFFRLRRSFFARILVCWRLKKGAESLKFSFFSQSLLCVCFQMTFWFRLKWKYFQSIKLRIKFMDTTRFRFSIAVHIFQWQRFEWQKRRWREKSHQNRRQDALYWVL